jgi:hypothetical protein
MIKWFWGLFSKRIKMAEDFTVPGWDLFNEWIDRIKKEGQLTEEERTYILYRIREEVRDMPSADFWNTPPIRLSCMWNWTKQDRASILYKAGIDYGL